MGESDEKQEKNVKISDFTKLLNGSNVFMKSLSQNEYSLSLFIENLIEILDPYQDLYMEDLILIIKSSLKKKDRKQRILKSSLIINDLINMNLNEIKNLIIVNKLTKDDLLMVAKHSLNMPIGTMQNIKKEFIKIKILNTIDNFEKLDTITKVAKNI